MNRHKYHNYSIAQVNEFVLHYMNPNLDVDHFLNVADQQQQEQQENRKSEHRQMFSVLSC